MAKLGRVTGGRPPDPPPSRWRRLVAALRPAAGAAGTPASAPSWASAALPGALALGLAASLLATELLGALLSWRTLGAVFLAVAVIAYFLLRRFDPATALLRALIGVALLAAMAIAAPGFGLALRLGTVLEALGVRGATVDVTAASAPLGLPAMILLGVLFLGLLLAWLLRRP